MEYGVKEASLLRAELANLRKILNKVMLPLLMVTDGLSVDYLLPGIGAANQYLPVLNDDANGWRIDVDGEMLTIMLRGGKKLRSRRLSREGGLYRTEEGELLRLGADLGEALISVQKSASEEYSGELNGLMKLCDATIRTGNPIEFS